MGTLNWPPTWSTLLLLPALFVGFTVHELAHALVAFMLGDTSQVERKRLSFNPLRHVSWFGMIAFLLIGLGWAKPVQVDQTRFRLKNHAFGMFLVSVAGATANFVTALLVLLAMSLTVAVVWIFTGTPPVEVLEFLMAGQPGPNLQGLVVALTYYMMMVNVLLALFNLLPLPPLDGFRAVMSLYLLARNALKGEGQPELAPQLVAGVAPTEESPVGPAQMHFNIGVEYQQEGQVDEAIARYRQALAHDPAFALAYYNEGVAYWSKGRPSLAISAFRAAKQSARTPGVRLQSDLRLRELSQAEKGSAADLGPPPPPLESEISSEDSAPGRPVLAPDLERRVWLRLGIGGAIALTLAFLLWLFVTAVTLASIG